MLVVFDKYIEGRGLYRYVSGFNKYVEVRGLYRYVSDV